MPKCSNASSKSKSKTKSKKSKSKDATKVKRVFHTWTTEDMEHAVAAVTSGAMSQRHAVSVYHVPRSTLQDRIKNGTQVKPKLGRKPRLSLEDEHKLVDYACNRAQLGIGFGKKQFLQYAGDLARKRKVSFKRGKPSQKWWRLMKRRHASLVRRKTEGTATVRHRQMNKVYVGKYFKAVKDILDKHELHQIPQRIWNMDETGLVLEHRPTKVIARRGSRYLQSRTSGNRELITLIATINAAGRALPPHLVVKGKTRLVLHGFDAEKAPEGTVMSVSDSGWTKQGIAALWFTEVFLKNIGPERPQLLIMDGHDSHCYVEMIEKALSEDIILVELPSHTSHWLQPLDRTVFYSLKSHYNEACQEFLNAWPNLTISHRNFCSLLAQAWSKAMTSANILSGFEAAGVVPYNPDKIPSEAYIPNTLYSEPLTSNVTSNSIAVGDSVSTSNVTSSDTTVDELNNDISVVTVSADRPIAEPLAPIGSESCFQVIDTHVDITCSGISSVENTVCVQSASALQQNDNGVERICPPELALSAVELSLTEKQRSVYMAHFLENTEIKDDPIFHTWKKYKLLVHKMPQAEQSTYSNANADVFPFHNTSCPTDVDSDVLPYPTVQKGRPFKNRKDQYFVLTAKEVYESKKAVQQTKEKKKQQVENRKKAREMARLQKAEAAAQKKILGGNSVKRSQPHGKRKLAATNETAMTTTMESSLATVPPPTTAMTAQSAVSESSTPPFVTAAATVSQPTVRISTARGQRKSRNKRRTALLVVDDDDSDNEPLAKKLSYAAQRDIETPCGKCGVIYGDQTDPRKCEQWISCACHKWFHESCAEDCGVFDDYIFICRDCASESD